MCTNNPANNLRVIDRRPQSELRVAFDLDDLKLIFERSPMYAGCESAHRRARPGNLIVKDSVFWFPLAALYTGARLGELAVATVDDLKEERGVTYLDIHAGRDNRHLKTKSSDRRVPIHAELVKMGFLEFVAERRDRGCSKIFGEVQGRRDIRTIHGWSQTWQVYQDHVDIRDRRKVFYSFRHNFKRACRDASIDEEVHDCLTGHRPYWGGRRYGEGISLDVLAKAMARIEYRGLDLSHLHIRAD
jgi:integrase